MSPGVKWVKGGWQAKHNNVFKVEKGFFGQLVEGNCGSFCGLCYSYGLMFVDLIVPRDVKNWKYFGEQNRSLMESTDGGWKNRIFKLSSGLCLQACIAFSRNGRVLWGLKVYMKRKLSLLYLKEVLKL